MTVIIFYNYLYFINKTLYRTKRINIKTRVFVQDKIIAVTPVLVDTWMLTVNLVYKLSNVPDGLKWTRNTYDIICTHFQGITNNMYGFGRLF